MCERIQKTKYRIFKAIQARNLADKKFDEAIDSGNQDEILKWPNACEHAHEYVDILNNRLKSLGGGEIFYG